MANVTEYSRLVFKRTTSPGTIPTIPTGTTIDSSWLPTDILLGEGFINLADDRFWFRTNTGIVEVSLSGSSFNSITTGATLVGDTIYFETPNSASAYTVNLSSIVSSGGTSGTPTLSQVLASGNTTGGNNIIITSGDSITSSVGAGSISLDGSKVTLNKAKINSIVFGFNDYILGSSSGDDVKYSYTHMYNGLAILTSSYTVDLSDKYGNYYPDTTSNPVTINLPSSASGYELTILDVYGNAGTNNITINASSGNTINGASSFVINSDYGGVKLTSTVSSAWTISSTNITSGGGGVGGSIWTAATYGTHAIRTNNGSTTDTSNASGDANYAIAAGYNNLVEGNYSVGMGGSNNYTGGEASGIFGGQDNITENATTRTFVIGGQSNIVKDSASNSGIIGGNTNAFEFLNTTVNTVIVGGNNITAKQSNMVYVPGLNIGTISGSPVSGMFLGLNNQNYVVTGNSSTSFFNYYTEDTTSQIAKTEITVGTATDTLLIDPSAAISSTNITSVDTSISGGSSVYITPTYSSLSTYDTDGVTYVAYVDTSYDSFANKVATQMQAYNFASSNEAKITLSVDLNTDASLINIIGDTLNITSSAIKLPSISSGTTTAFLGLDSTGKIVSAATPCDFSFAISDETTAITSGTSKLTFYAPYAFTITNVYGSLSTSGSTSSTFDINKNGTSVLSRIITVDANEFHSKDASLLPIISTTSVAQFDKLSIDIDSAGTGAKGAKIYIVGTRTI